MSSERDWGIRVESVSKRFRITPAGEAGSRRWPRRPRRVPLWAVKDLSFEVPRGSTLGVIGRNGAGKTTVLKLLSRITPPTTGRIVLAGQASSLLEVGTGFHQELTGRENIFLNGAILGMGRREIERKFDEIVEFSEVGEFIDTPVKRYSSGMNLRLAFAVAAHLDPEILLVDEVLAVGDAAFQQKSLGKMEEATGHGRTVVLVSHNMSTIASLADQCLWLDRGEVAALGPTSEVIARYLEASLTPLEKEEVDLGGHHRADYLHQNVRFTTARLRDVDGRPGARFYEGDPIQVELDLEVVTPVPFLELRAYIRTIEGIWLFSSLSGKNPVDLEPGPYRVTTTIDPNHLSPGHYRIDLAVGSGVPQDDVEDALRFEVEHSLQGYDDPVLRSDVGRLRFRFPWTELRPVAEESVIERVDAGA